MDGWRHLFKFKDKYIIVFNMCTTRFHGVATHLVNFSNTYIISAVGLISPLSLFIEQTP